MKKCFSRTALWGMSITFLLSTMLGMYGCGKEDVEMSGGSNAETAVSTTSKSIEPAKKDSVEITVWSHLQQNTEVPVLKKIAEEWAEKTGNKVKVLFDASSFQAYVQAASSSKGPDIMYGIANDNLGTFNTAKLLDEVPADVITKDKYSQGSIDAVTIGGKAYAVPVAVESIALFYNTDKVKTPPATWDELIEQAKNVGFATKLDDLYMVWPFISGKGGYVYKYKDGVYDTKDLGLGAPSKDGYALINSLVNEYGFMKPDITGTIANGMFKNGKTGFYVGGPWEVADFKKQTKLKFSVVPFPTMDGKIMKSFIGVQCAFVSSKSKNKDIAWDLMKYLNENSAMALYKSGTRIPALLSAQQGADFMADTMMSAFAAQAKIGEPLPNVPEMADTWKSYEDNIKLLFTKKLTLDQMTEKIDKDIRQKNKDRNSGSGK